MKNIIKSFIIFAAAALVLNGCGEAEPIIYDGPVFVSFTDGTMADYFVQADNTPFPVQVGIPSPHGSDITIDLEVLYASGEAGTHYDLPSSVTIPAGDVVATIPVKGYFDNLAGGRKDTVMFQLLGEEVASFDTAYTVYLQQFCPFDIANFEGDWTANEQSDYEEEPYAPYTITFEANPNGGDTLVTDDIWPYFPVKVVFDDADPANFFWRIPDQFLSEDLFGYGEARIVDLGPGAFSACELKMSIRYKVYVSAGNFEQATLQLVKD